MIFISSGNSSFINTVILVPTATFVGYPGKVNTSLLHDATVPVRSYVVTNVFSWVFTLYFVIVCGVTLLIRKLVFVV